MEIKVATKEDFKRLEPVLLEVEWHHVELVPEVFRAISEYDQNHFNELVESDSCRVFYLEIGGKVAGVLIAIEREYPPNPMYVGGRYTEVEELSVSKDYRRMGVAKALMKHAEEWTIQQGNSRIQLSVWKKNQGAIEFYEEMGYSQMLLRYKKDLKD